jgi:dephospho-CoA kinase
LIAITGGAASGKSFVLEILREHGLRTISADAVVAALWNDPAIRQRAAKAIGLDEPFDAAAVRAKILSDPAARRRLNAVFHAPVIRQILESGADFAEIPLLIETCSQRLFGGVWLVTCGIDLQRQRLAERGLSGDQIDQILGSQLDDAVRAQFSDEIIRTNESRERVIANVKQRLQAISRVSPQ